MTSALDRLADLEKAATKGPWQFGSWGGSCTRQHGPEENGPWHGKGFCVYEPVLFGDNDKHRICTSVPNISVAGNYDYEDGGIVNASDAELIVAARNSLPALLRVARAAQRVQVALDLGPIPPELNERTNVQRFALRAALTDLETIQ